MPGKKPASLPEVDMRQLSPQQKEIYRMTREGLKYKKIAEMLGIKVSQVSSQLCRIRKKAKEQEQAYVYKNTPGAEPARKHRGLVSPAEELKQKMQADPGFFRLLREKYGDGGVLPREEGVRLSSASGGDAGGPVLSQRIKVLSASGKGANSNRVVVRLNARQKKSAARFLKQRKLSPVKSNWDDGSSLFIMSTEELEGLRSELNYHWTRLTFRGG
jgi:DNA-binding CsgD family transcriptional regulator